MLLLTPVIVMLYSIFVSMYWVALKALCFQGIKGISRVGSYKMKSFEKTKLFGRKLSMTIIKINVIVFMAAFCATLAYLHFKSEWSLYHIPMDKTISILAWNISKYLIIILFMMCIPLFIFLGLFTVNKNMDKNKKVEEDSNHSRNVDTH